MRSEEEIRARANTDHYHTEVEVKYSCELDGWCCDQEGIESGEGPDCSECEKHKKWVLNEEE